MPGNRRDLCDAAHNLAIIEASSAALSRRAGSERTGRPAVAARSKPVLTLGGGEVARGGGGEQRALCDEGGGRGFDRGDIGPAARAALGE
jgi:hypothetical protein